MARLAPPDPPLRDDVVALRDWARRDAAALVEICQDAEIPRWTLAPSPYGMADAHRFLNHVEDGWATGATATLAIVDTYDGRLLGNAGLQAIDWDQQAADVGYMLAAPARGRGLATRAVGLLADWAFGPLGLSRLEIRAEVGNAPSQAVAQRAGFRRVPAPLVRRPECEHLDDVYFALLRDDASG